MRKITLLSISIFFSTVIIGQTTILTSRVTKIYDDTSINKKKIDSIPVNTIVTVIGIVETYSINDSYFHVTYKNTTGWIFNKDVAQNELFYHAIEDFPPKPYRFIKDTTINIAGKAINPNTQSFSRIIYSNSWHGSSGLYYYSFSDIDINNYKNDFVMAFCQIASSGDYFNLPSTNFLANGDNLSFAYDNGAIIFFYFNSSVPSMDLNIKIIDITPASHLANPNVNWKNYIEVKKTFNLPD